MGVKNVKWYVIAFMLCIPGVVMLRSCVLFKTVASQARLTRLLTSLPEPEKVVLLDEVVGVGGGSDDRCYTAYVHRLYGSDRTSEDVFDFFQDTLLSGGEWAQIESHSGSRRITFFDRKDGFRLTVDYNIESYATRGFTQFSERSLSEAQQQFALPFVVVVNHADSATRKSCWPGWEP
jgi:hypothetical protein